MLPSAPAPLSPVELHILAESHKSAGRLPEAEKLLRQILQVAPEYHPAYHTLGLIAYEVGKLPLAVELISQAIKMQPDIGLYHRNAGEMCRRLGRLDEAVKFGMRATELSPDDLDAHYNLGLALTDQCAWGASITAYKRALELNPKHGLSWNNLGAALEKQGDLSAAEAAYANAIALNPEHSEAQTNLGAMYSEQGRLEDACLCFEAAIKAKPDFIEPHYNLSSLKTYTENDPHLHILERNLDQMQTLPLKARIRYWFALGKAREDVGLYDAAFAAYEAGNKLQHEILPFDETRADEVLQGVMQVFNKEFFADRKDVKGNPAAPIFIVGMPRSGTTLLEQVLSSHPAVYGAGELMDLHEVVLSAETSAQRFPYFATNIKPEDFAKLGAAYVERVQKLAPNAQRITDKMPANFFYLGMIHLMLPNAKIIHAMRDPMDSCLSCYSRLFNDTMEFAYDLGTLGRYYVRYIHLMRHWHQVLPAGKILDLRYEDMVADTEGQARRILEFLDLPWDDNCLAFHQNKRHVKTASVAQVRKPIYKTSVEKWRRFEKHLQPLLQIVNEYRDHPDELPKPRKRSAVEQTYEQGVHFYRQGQIEAAITSYQQALQLKPKFPIALNSLGYALQDLDRLEEARNCFERALALQPDYDMARLNLGMVQLKLGDWASGWENYEARWSGSAEAISGNFKPVTCPLPQWTGQADTAADSLLIITEQGFGDVFQFARYFSLAKTRFARVGFACSAPTRRLLEWTLGQSVTLMSRVPPKGKGWDWHCPMMSLPRAFASRPDNVPNQTPYLSVPAAESARWQERIAATGKITIGIAWAGRKAHVYDARRSMSLQQLEPLFKDPRFVWVNLQKWDKENFTPPIQDRWLDWTEELTDFADTAALITALDLVISIDSAMVHLAGALNKPVWMMNRFDGEWRWLRRREDSVWYPTMRIFNQPSLGDWASVVKDVTEALNALPAKSKTRKRKPVAQSITTTKPTPQAASLSIEQALDIASQHQSQGRLQEAEHLLRQVLQVQPNNAFALHLLGVIAYQAGKPELAIDLIEKAISNNNSVALFHANLGEMLRQQGKLDMAIQHGEQAVTLDANMASAHSNLGVAYFDRKDYDLAEASHQRALQIAPQFSPSLNNLGSIYKARKEMGTALEWYRKAVVANPHYLEPLNNMGAVLLEEERYQEAQEPLVRALQINPNYVEAVCNLGLVKKELEQPEAAQQLLHKALQLKPDYPEACLGLARVAQDAGNLPQAEKYALRAVELAPEKPDGLSLLGSLYNEMGRGADAVASYERALKLDPEHAEALLGLGNLDMENGDMEKAEHLFRQVLELEPDNIGARFHLSQVKKVKADDANFAALLEVAKDIDTLPSKKAISLHFALGKCYEDSGQHALAFPHFLEGCRLKRATFEYSSELDRNQFAELMRLMDKPAIERLRGAGNPSPTPIFVLGMPRSGTTLTEQIIASHPQVHGAGELADLMDILQRDFEGNGAGFPQNLATLTPEKLSILATEYVTRLQQHAPDAKHITDKMPSNFYAVGLIHLMLPNAKIIHVNRNPVDTCVSCFTRLFNRKQYQTYDLAELGQHYASYAKLMNHWRKVLPADAFLDVQYEDIVADKETEARRLIEYCGLEWDDACLDFHNTKRAIRTASVTQVRQPIYKTSVERWRNYEQFLTPLLDALGDLAPK